MAFARWIGISVCRATTLKRRRCNFLGGAPASPVARLSLPLRSSNSRFTRGLLRELVVFSAAIMVSGCARSTPITSPPTIARDEKGIVIVAAGDISCDPASSHFNQGKGTANRCRMLATSEVAISLKPAAVLLLGDTQYEKGELAAFEKSWAHNWGRKELREISYPAVGNHEYKTKGASGYFDYFGSRAGERDKGYYSFNLGTWHLVALNSAGHNGCRPVPCAEGSQQVKWLQKDLEQNDSACTLAFWHRPLFTSGLHSNARDLRPFWTHLYENRADVILNGHSHQYERYSRQRPDGQPDPERGIMQFVVGTGGKNLKGFVRKQRNSEVRNSSSYGVLRMELREKSYAWEFISDGGNVLDSGSAECHPKRLKGIANEERYETPRTQ